MHVFWTLVLILFCDEKVLEMETFAELLGQKVPVDQDKVWEEELIQAGELEVKGTAGPSQLPVLVVEQTSVSSLSAPGWGFCSLWGQTSAFAQCVKTAAMVEVE